MRQVPLGRSGISVSALCLGTMTFGRQTAPAEAHAQLDRAADAGINFLDTAEMYPTNPILAESVGATEEIIGEWFARRGGRDRWTVATKIAGAGSKARGGEPIGAASIRRAVEASLRRLRSERIELYQFHWPNRGSYHFRQSWTFDPSGQDRAATLAHMVEALETLAALKAEGKIAHFGLSNESAWGMAQWLRLAEAGHGPRPASIQNEYSLLCRLYDTDLAELAVHEDVTLLAFSPLAAGLLSGKYAGDVVPEGSRRAATPDLGGRIAPRVWPAIAAYRAIAADAGLDPVRMAVAWTMTRPFPVVPIIGATNMAQLDHLIPAAELSLPAEVLQAVSAAHRAHPMPY